MTEDEKKDLYEKSKITAKNVKIATTSPEIKDKIRSNITTETTAIFWYIRFNTTLDPSSVSRKTMNVTERNGYIVDTLISYDRENHLIAICPIDCYAENEYYLLNISKKVRSENGSRLKREINIMFKIMGDKITEYKILAPGTSLPKPKPRPKGYAPKGKVVYPVNAVVKSYTFDKDKFDKLPKDKLPYETLKFNPVIAVIGVIAAAVGIIISNIVVIFAAAAVCVIGIAHIFFQLTRRTKRAAFAYNVGAFRFNRGSYKKAQKSFEKSASIDDMNEYAEFASDKVKFYL